MKRVPDFIFFLLSLAAVAVSPVAASVIYRQFFHTDWSLTLRNIVIHELKDIPLQLITLGCLFAGIMIAYVLTGANRTNSDVKSIRTIKVTDKIRIPVPAGDGQYGNARFLTKKEIRQKYTITDRENLPNVKQVVALLDYKKKLDITTLRRKENFTIMTNDGHVLIVGGTRSGKTRRELLENIALSIDAGNNNVVMDVKGELYAYTSGYAEQHGVEKPIVIDFVNPLRSTRYNYMQTINAAVDAANAEEGEVKDYSAAEEATLDLVSILVKESRGLDPLWYNGECAAIAAAIMCVAMEAPKEQRNLTTVYWFLGEMTEVNPDGEIKLTDYLKNLPGDHPAKKLFMMARSSPSKTRGSFFSSALGTLSLFANDMVAYMTSQDDFDLTKLDEKRQIIYIIVPDEKKKYHPLASLLMAQLTIALAESARQNGGRCKYSWIFRWDEFGNSPKVANMGSYVSMMAGRGILYNLVVQDYSQLKQYGDESDTILANMACTIYLRTTHPKTLEAISRATGKYTVLSASQSDSYKSSELSGTHQVSSSTNLMGRELLTPHEIGLFETPYALCLPGGNCFVSNLPDISNYDIHEELGMGSVEQNQELLMEAVNKRPLNPLIKPEPWNPYEKIVETVHPPEEKKKKEQQNPPEEEKDKNMTIHAADSKTSGKVLGTITESVFRQSHTVSPEENLFSEKADRKNKEAKEKREEEKQQ